MVFIALFCAAIKRDSISLMWFPLCSHVHFFLCAISSVCFLKYPYSCFTFYLFSNFCCFSVCLLMLPLQLLVAKWIFLGSFYCSLWVLVLMHRHNPQCCRFLFLLFFLTHTHISLLIYKFTKPSTLNNQEEIYIPSFPSEFVFSQWEYDFNWWILVAYMGWDKDDKSLCS